MEVKVAEVFPPSEFIKEEMEARGWDLDTLVKLTLLTKDCLYEVLEHNKRITPIVALGLSKAFDTSRELWMNLQKGYDESLRFPTGEKI